MLRETLEPMKQQLKHWLRIAIRKLLDLMRTYYREMVKIPCFLGWSRKS